MEKTLHYKELNALYGTEMHFEIYEVIHRQSSCINMQLICSVLLTKIAQVTYTSLCFQNIADFSKPPKLAFFSLSQR